MIKLLDCTLRDGGYYTNWDFSSELAQKYFEYINKLPIEYIEIGYRGILKNEYYGEYFYLPLVTLKNIRKSTSKKLALMLNAKECINIDLKVLLKDTKEYISLIRIATDPDKIEFSIELAKKIKEFGFEVALNIMYISKIDENHKIFQNLENITQYVDTLNLVDSYGSIFPNELEKIIKKIKISTDVSLGFHGHNNLELAFSNTLRAIECGVEYIDSTVLGMGRGAGNLKTELILAYLKSKKKLKIDLNNLSKLSELFTPLLLQYKWGSNLAYNVSGCYALPQKNVMDALEIDRYSLAGIVNQLENDSHSKHLIFKSQELCENCLIIGGGQSILTHMLAIKEFLLKNKHILIIHATSKYIKLFEDVRNIQYFAVAGDELLKLTSMKKINKIILEPSPRKINVNVEKIKNIYELEQIEFIEKYSDSPLTISLQVVLDMQVNNIYLAGFDGYSELKTKKEFYLMQENQEIINNFTLLNVLKSLTKSKYKNLIQKSIYGIL